MGESLLHKFLAALGRLPVAASKSICVYRCLSVMHIESSTSTTSTLTLVIEDNPAWLAVLTGPGAPGA
ncbi:MAG: hypothetical protein NTZ78_07475 [Candidatus Aureabacteria bacterium]|nr:hypothetical protein [Candidatus Auribacterota bacterium]